MKKTFQINKYIVVLVTIFLTGVQLAGANEELFKNNLLKMDVYKTAQGSVKVTFYTTKPYTEAITVNKKGENDYVIFMPETSNSLTAKPSLKSASDVISNIEVKTQQYSQTQGQKGYTKIIISSLKPVEIIPQVQTLNTSSYQLSEKDYQNLITQSSKKPSAIKPKAELEKQTKPILVTKSMTIPAKKIEPQKQIQKITRKPVTRLLSAPKQSQALNPTIVATENASKPKLEEPQTIQKELTKPVVEEATTPEIITPAETQAQTPVPTKVQAEGKYQKYKNFIKKNFYLFLGLISLFFMLLLLNLIRKNKAKPINPQAVEDIEEIEEDVDWKEKLKKPTFKEEINQATIQNETQDLNELFTNEPETEIKEEKIQTIDEEPFTEAEEEVPSFYEQEQTEPEEEMPSIYEEFGTETEIENEISIDELFGDEDYEEFNENNINIIEEIPWTQEIAEPQQEEIYQEEAKEESDQLVLSTFVIDDTKGFYLVDVEGTTALVGHIGEEIFILKRFDDSIQGEIQARLNEKGANFATFMIKVENFKGIVEITPSNMKLLIEL